MKDDVLKNPSIKKNKKISDIIVKIIVIVYCTAITAGFIMHYSDLDYDVLWHIKMGKDITETGCISTENYYSWIEGTHWGQQEWLFDFLLYNTVKYLDIWGYYAIFAINRIFLFFLAYKIGKPQNWPTFFLLFVLFSIILPSTNMNRPSFYSTFIFLFLIWQHDKPKYTPLCFAAGALMANFHCGPGLVAVVFLFTLVVLEIILGFVYKNHDYLTNSAVSLFLFCIGLLCNVRGYHVIVDMIKAIGLTSNQVIQEWQPLSYNGIINASVFIFIVMSLGYAFKNTDRKNITNIACITIFLILGMISRKSCELFTPIYIVFGYKYAEQLMLTILSVLTQPRKPKLPEFPLGRREAALVAVMGFIAGGIAFGVKTKYSFDTFVEANINSVVPKEIIEYLQENNGKRILNGYGDGNCLMWHDIKVFLDTRQHPYTNEMGHAHSMEDYIDLRFECNVDSANRIFKEYEFEEVLVTPNLDIDWYMRTRDDYEKIFDIEDVQLWVKK